MATGDPFSIGVSGLLATQRALATTSHNIANANTPGFSRQRTELAAQLPEFSGNGFIGTGVSVATVRRAYDSFLTEQVQSNTSEHAQLETFHALAAQVDHLLADPAVGLSPPLQQFFNSVQEMADDPSAPAPRQALLAEGEVLASRFHLLDGRLSDLDDSINTQLQDTVAEVNTLASSIAGLNQRILEVHGQTSGQPANDLLDQRDQLIGELAQKVAVTAFPQADGMVNVVIGNGQSLVVGNQSSTLTTMANPYDNSRLEIGYTAGDNTLSISNHMAGGELGALLTFRDQVLEPSRNALGQLAIGFSQTVNVRHQVGMDLNGELGRNFFAPVDSSAPASLPRADNTGDGIIEINVSDVSELSDSNYRLDRNGADYTLTRLSDNQAFSLAAFPGGEETVDGLTLNLTSGTINAGDSYLIRPTRGAAQKFEVALSDSNSIAAAVPIRTEANLENEGSGRISAASVSHANGLPLPANGQISLTYDAAAQQFNVSGGPGGTLDYDPATERDGKEFTFPASGGTTFTISGAPADGDTFVIANNTGGVSDNRNALALAASQGQSSLQGGTATFQEHYSSLVVDVGVQTRQAEANRDTHRTLLDQAVAAREGVSGVNLEEEAANLLRFQQAFQAAARVISTADTMFQSLLGAIGR